MKKKTQRVENLPEECDTLFLDIRRYVVDTMAMRATACGALVNLLVCYCRNGPLPDRADELARIARCSQREWLTVRRSVLTWFHKGDDGRWHSLVGDESVARYKRLRNRAVNAANVRWGKPPQAASSSSVENVRGAVSVRDGGGA